MSITWSARADRRLVVLDDDHGVPGVAQAQRGCSSRRCVVARVEADRRLVEDVEHAHQAASPPAWRAGCAAPRRPRASALGAVERQVAEARRRAGSAAARGSRASTRSATARSRAPSARPSRKRARVARSRARQSSWMASAAELHARARAASACRRTPRQRRRAARSAAAPRVSTSPPRGARSSSPSTPSKRRVDLWRAAARARREAGSRARPSRERISLARLRGQLAPGRLERRRRVLRRRRPAAAR